METSQEPWSIPGVSLLEIRLFVKGPKIRSYKLFGRLKRGVSWDAVMGKAEVLYEFVTHIQYRICEERNSLLVASFRIHWVSLKDSKNTLY